MKNVKNKIKPKPGINLIIGCSNLFNHYHRYIDGGKVVSLNVTHN